MQPCSKKDLKQFTKANTTKQIFFKSGTAKVRGENKKSNNQHLLNTYCVAGTVLSPSYIIPFNSHSIEGGINMPILQIRKLRPGKLVT